MGNGTAKIAHCLSGAGTISCRHDIAGVSVSDEGLGHSFCYIRPDDVKTTAFRAISGAAVSANNSTPLSTADDLASSALAFDRASSFESSTLFASVPLQRSGPADQPGFLSGPIERSSVLLDDQNDNNNLSSSEKTKTKTKTSALFQALKRVVFSKTPRRGKKPAVAAAATSDTSCATSNDDDRGESSVSSSVRRNDNSDKVQWAQGKAGEDRVHVVISEGWVFVGIYDGFNGPDAPDYLVSNLYAAVHDGLRGVVWGCHEEVLGAAAAALARTEEGFLAAADSGINPELALMGSCVLAMIINGHHLYLINVGDSRAVLARSGDNVVAVQLTMDHSTYVLEEVERIRREHPDDASAVVNERVKGYLKVTRAFGAGFLKQPKWNDALLEMFRIDYKGTRPYLTCEPSMVHRRLSSEDKFLILSSDGLYQYFTNDQAVSEVDLFMDSFPEGDPAQHLVEQVLFRAAKKAGMDFHELLDIPQGERRRYHDDVSIIVISFEGRIWRSSV